MDQANIGRSLVIKGEVTGAESLFIDGRVEGTISFPDNRVTIGRNGNVAANIVAQEVVIMGKVQGNVECADRLDVRSEGMLSGDVITHRISIEEGAILKGGVEVRNPEKKEKDKKTQEPAQNKQESPKAMAATAGNAEFRAVEFEQKLNSNKNDGGTGVSASRARACPELAEGTPGAPSFSFSWMYYFFGLKSRDAEFMQ